MKYITLKYRIKDATSRKKLERFANSVNMVWNYCNEVSHKSITYNNKWLSKYDLANLTVGVAAGLGIHSNTVASVCDEYALKRKKHKKIRLNWRSSKRSLGWIPFKSQAVKYLGNGKLSYCKHVFKFWESRKVLKIKTGSFNQNSKGDWYLNLVCEDIEYTYLKTNKEIGIDLGLKRTATYSNGELFEGKRPFRKLENKLAIASRARKKKQIKNIYKKIANIRKDSIHKETTRLVKNYDNIFIGDVSSIKLAKTKMAKSTLDNSWGAYKSMLAYKTIKFGKEFKVVNEAWTTVTCSKCLERTFPKKSGLGSLSVREWHCLNCGEIHNRDVNAAKNILRIGLDTLNKGVLVNQEEANPQYQKQMDKVKRLLKRANTAKKVITGGKSEKEFNYLRNKVSNGNKERSKDL